MLVFTQTAASLALRSDPELPERFEHVTLWAGMPR